MLFAEATQEVEVHAACGIDYDLLGLAPGRRRAAQFREEVEREFAHILNLPVEAGIGPVTSSPAQPSVTTSAHPPALFEAMPTIEVSRTADNVFLKF
jgi:hypothetical protein